MHTILLIAHSEADRAGLAALVHHGQATMSLRFAGDDQAAIAIAREEPIDSIIYDLASFPASQVENLHLLTMRLPDVPCIAIVDEDGHEAEAALRAGISKCLARPVLAEPFGQLLNDQVKIASLGQVRTIPPHSLLQMLEGEEKTCTVKVTSKGQTGYIFMHRGQVVDARTQDREGLPAFNTIVNWEKPTSEIRYFNGKRPRLIDKPLISLIMEALRPKSEQERLEQASSEPAPAPAPLMHKPTTGSRIALDIGAKIKMELDGQETPLNSTLVGMVPDELLIVTAPAPFTAAENKGPSGGRIVIKYLHMGRLCMFKTQLLRVIESPTKLFFLDYPQAIHYHELRRAKRRSIFIPCTVHLARGPEFYGVLIDLSTTGCLCQIKAKGNSPLPSLDIESKVQLHCLLPGLKEDQELTAVVKSIRRSTAETRIGLEFVGLQAYLSEAIERYVYATDDLAG